jgi:hypothetical protein
MVTILECLREDENKEEKILCLWLVLYTVAHVVI